MASTKAFHTSSPALCAAAGLRDFWAHCCSDFRGMGLRGLPAGLTDVFRPARRHGRTEDTSLSKHYNGIGLTYHLACAWHLSGRLVMRRDGHGERLRPLSSSGIMIVMPVLTCHSRPAEPAELGRPGPTLRRRGKYLSSRPTRCRDRLRPGRRRGMPGCTSLSPPGAALGCAQAGSHASKAGTRTWTESESSESDMMIMLVGAFMVAASPSVILGGRVASFLRVFRKYLTVIKNLFGCQSHVVT